MKLTTWYYFMGFNTALFAAKGSLHGYHNRGCRNRAARVLPSPFKREPVSTPILDALRHAIEASAYLFKPLKRFTEENTRVRPAAVIGRAKDPNINYSRDWRLPDIMLIEPEPHPGICPCCGRSRN